MILPILGIAGAALVDVLIPLVLAILLTRWNIRHRRAGVGEAVHSVAAVLHLGILALIVWRGIEGVLAYAGEPVIAATIFAGPLGLIPAIYNSGAVHYFFTSAQWADFGYVIVLTMYVGGMLAWAYLGHAAILAQAIRYRLAGELRHHKQWLGWEESRSGVA